MNKWVVLILMALAFAAGGMSFYRMGQKANGEDVAVASSLSPAPESATPVASSTPERPVGLAAGTRRGPNFGPPPQPGAARTPGSNPFGPEKKPAVVMGEIQAHVFSTESGGPSRTRFPKKTGNIYMSVTPVKMSDSTELVASIRSAMSEGEAFSQPVQSSGPPRLRTFRFAPPAGGWVSGPYQVVVKPAGSEQVILLSRFEVDKEGAVAATPAAKPSYLNLVNDLARPDLTGSVFSQADANIHLVVDSERISPGAKVRSVWSAVEAEQLTPGELVAASEMNPPGGEQDAVFTFAPPKGGFLPGSYRVDVYVEQQQVGSQAFFIQPAEAAASTPVTSSPTP